MTQHRKYNSIKSDLERFLMDLMPKINILNPNDKVIYDNLCNAIEHAHEVSSREFDVYESND
jgi:hypothetical protein